MTRGPMTNGAVAELTEIIGVCAPAFTEFTDTITAVAYESTKWANSIPVDDLEGWRRYRDWLVDLREASKLALESAKRRGVPA